MDDKGKRAIKLWTKHTVENLEDIIETENLNEDEVNALKMTIDILNRKKDEL